RAELKKLPELRTASAGAVQFYHHAGMRFSLRGESIGKCSDGSYGILACKMGIQIEDGQYDEVRQIEPKLMPSRGLVDQIIRHRDRQHMNRLFGRGAYGPAGKHTGRPDFVDTPKSRSVGGGKYRQLPIPVTNRLAPGQRGLGNKTVEIDDGISIRAYHRAIE